VEFPVRRLLRLEMSFCHEQGSPLDHRSRYRILREDVERRLAKVESARGEKGQADRPFGGRAQARFVPRSDSLHDGAGDLKEVVDLRINRRVGPFPDDPRPAEIPISSGVVFIGAEPSRPVSRPTSMTTPRRRFGSLEVWPELS